MPAVDHTQELQRVFAHLCSEQLGGQETTTRLADTPAHALGPSVMHPLLEAVSVTTEAQCQASSNARRRIRETLAALDSFAPFSTARLEGQLLLCEAELTSVSATLRELSSSLQQTKAEVVGATEAKKSVRDRVPSSPQLPPSQLLEHVEGILSATRKANVDMRERLALCKEELALYKNDMYRFARCGIVSCEPEDIVLGGGGGGGRTRVEAAKGADAGRVLAGKERVNSRSGFGLMSGVARNVMQMDGFLKHAVPVSLSSLGTATTAGLGGFLATTGGVADFLRPTGSGASGAPARGVTVAAAELQQPLPEAPHFHYSEEEESHLWGQQQGLLHKQQEASANDAKLVEASVRELSQLTSLMNEKVVEQNELFSVLVRNTAQAKNNYDKALGELHKAEKSSHGLSATRQLILLLWGSTAVLLMANWLFS